MHRDDRTDATDLLTQLHEFVARTGLSAPCTSFMERRIPVPFAPGRVIIDGSFGGPSRYDMLHRSGHLLRFSVRTRDVDRLLPALAAERPAIFSHDVMRAMVAGARESILHTLECMPPASEYSPADFANLFAIRTVLPDLALAVGATMQEMALCELPFAQATLLRTTFRTPGGHIKRYKDFVREHHSSLARYALVNDGIRCPFVLPEVPASIYRRIHAAWSAPLYDPTIDVMWAQLSEYALDLLMSRQVRESMYYRYGFLHDAVTRYFRGELRFRSVVDRWLAFELWQESLRERGVRVRDA